MTVHRELREALFRLIIMDVTPERVEKPPAVYLYGLLVSAGWSVGWPALAAVFKVPLKNPNLIWLTHAAAVVWLLSLIGCFGILAVLKDYSPIFSFIWDGLVFVVEVLSFLPW